MSVTSRMRWIGVTVGGPRGSVSPPVTDDGAGVAPGSGEPRSSAAEQLAGPGFGGLISIGPEPLATLDALDATLEAYDDSDLPEAATVRTGAAVEGAEGMTLSGRADPRHYHAAMR